MRQQNMQHKVPRKNKRRAAQYRTNLKNRRGSEKHNEELRASSAKVEEIH